MNSTPIRVLHFTGPMDRAGAETFMINVYRNIDRSKVQFDFYILGNIDGYYNEEILKLGGKIYNSTVSRKKEPIASIKKIFSFFKKHSSYSIIHLHKGNLTYIDPIVIAQKCNIPTRILHSHCGYRKNTSLLFKILTSINKKFFRKNATHRFACSPEAGQCMFDSLPFEVIPNGIDTEAFTFDNSIRQSYRSYLGIENSFVVGHVGRFATQKNHTFLCDVFYEIYKKNNNAVLLLIGRGPLEKNIRQKINELNISHAVKFLDVREDISELMQAMDLFLLPSLYEGFPVTLVEAQTTGLPCIVSTTICKEVQLTEHLHFLPLEESAEHWADYSLHVASTKINREESGKLLTETKYNIKHTARILEEFYIARAMSATIRIKP